MRTVLTFALLLLATAARAAPPPEADRKAILGMAGDYRVRFDFRETVSFRPDYTPLPQKLSGGYESVRVIADRPGFISLQHMLVVGEDKSPSVVKHWRQDWTWEPKSLVVYTGRDAWRTRPVAAAQAAGAWSQTVWQTDDSPRYGGVGKWRHDGGASRWTSDVTRRPLPRRDATRFPPYAEVDGINRHALTPTGWVHEQDNEKVGVKDGRESVFVHESGLNTYTRFSGYPVSAADSYWKATAPYWAEVRRAWDAQLARGEVVVREEAQNGSMTGPKLMGLADEIAEGKRDTAAAVIEARRVIATETGRQRATASAVRSPQGSPAS